MPASCERNLRKIHNQENQKLPEQFDAVAIPFLRRVMPVSLKLFLASVEVLMLTTLDEDKVLSKAYNCFLGSKQS